eukprot:1813112-Amphidinium_carterae.1
MIDKRRSCARRAEKVREGEAAKQWQVPCSMHHAWVMCSWMQRGMMWGEQQPTSTHSGSAPGLRLTFALFCKPDNLAGIHTHL